MREHNHQLPRQEINYEEMQCIRSTYVQRRVQTTAFDSAHHPGVILGLILGGKNWSVKAKLNQKSGVRKSLLTDGTRLVIMWLLNRLQKPIYSTLHEMSDESEE